MPEWEIERDRFGVMFSGPLQVGECIRVVPAKGEIDPDMEIGPCRHGSCVDLVHLRAVKALSEARRRDVERLEARVEQLETELALREGDAE